MFFRASKETDCIACKAIVNWTLCYTIEDHTGILGIAELKENKITIVQCSPDHYMNFLTTIEEFLFMKYTQIIVYNSPQCLENHGWYKQDDTYQKEKLGCVDRRILFKVHTDGNSS